MKSKTPVDPRVRLAISQWPGDAPRGSVTTFCTEHEISRKTFYLLLKRAREHGQAAVLEPQSRRPHTSPTKISHEVKEQAVQVRAALEASGLDHGPISVHDKMRAMNLDPVPSVASLARIFRETGVARMEPKKKPRAAFRMFVYPAPNACWQLDATEYVLTRGRKCVIFQLQDDHSRVAVASHVAVGETSEAALTVFKKGVAARGVPQRLLTDNGVALNPSRRGMEGQLVTYVTSLGVEAITGKPYKPTTQGKNERFHQTLFRWLDKQPLAETIEQLQAQVDTFDQIYNEERPHQGLPGRLTPQAAWEKTPVAESPKPPPAPVAVVVPSARVPASDATQTPGSQALVADCGEREMRVQRNGTIQLRRIRFQITSRLAGEFLQVAWDRESVVFARKNGEVVAEHPWPASGVMYVSNGVRPGGRRKMGGNGELSPMS